MPEMHPEEEHESLHMTLSKVLLHHSSDTIIRLHLLILHVLKRVCRHDLSHLIHKMLLCRWNSRV